MFDDTASDHLLFFVVRSAICKLGLALLPGVLSRKKQIIPKLEAAAKLEEL